MAYAYGTDTRDMPMPLLDNVKSQLKRSLLVTVH